MDVTLTIALPTTRKDNSSVGPADTASLNIFRADGSNAPKLIGTVNGPFSAPTVTFTDHNAPVGNEGYTCDAVDAKGIEGVVSDAFPLVIAAPLAPLSAPVIVSATQA